MNTTCICCPFGCLLNITKTGNEYVVTGNRCPRGRKHAIEEMSCPQRIVTSTVKINNGRYAVIPVKTEKPVPKEKIFTIMHILASVKTKPPINLGDIIIKNVANTGINIVATNADQGKENKK